MGTTLVGSPETVIRGIERLQGYSGGGFGGLLFRAHEWANRELTLRSYELFARYVMPHFQGSLATVRDSNELGALEPEVHLRAQRGGGAPRLSRTRAASVPEEFRDRTVGARDVPEDPPGAVNASAEPAERRRARQTCAPGREAI